MKNIFMLFLILAIGVAVAGCGGGGGSGNTNGSIVLTVPVTSIAAGKSFSATAVFAGIAGKPVNNLRLKFVSDDKEIIPDLTDPNATNLSGVAQVTLNTKNIKSTASTVNIYAVYEGVRSNIVAITVNPAVLTLTPPGDASLSFTADTVTNLCAAGATRLVNSGAQIKFVNSSNQNVYNQPVSIAVTSITNGRVGDQVVIFPDGPDSIEIPPYTTSVTVNTDTNGVWFLPVAIDSLVPVSKDGQHVFTVNWQASTQALGDLGLLIPYVVSGQTMLTVSCE